MKKIMTYEQLLKFCEEHNFNSFDSSESGYQLCISVPAQFEVEDSTEDSMMFANIRVFHTGLNRNHSSVTKQAMQKSLSGFKYKPILCNYTTVTLEDGTEVLDFSGHDMELDEEGNVIYIEKQVGCFTADQPVMKYDRSKKRYYVYAKCAIPREYTPAADIIDRRGGTDVSAELYVNKMSYDAKKKELLLEDIELAGCTLLAASKTPGMEDAHLQIEDFAINEKIPYEQNNELLDALKELNKHLEELNIYNAEGKEEKPMDKFTELLEKYEKTVEDITFEYSDMSDEELETAFAEAFEAESEKEQDEMTEQFDDDPEDDSNDDDSNDDDSEDEESDSEEEAVVIDDDPAPARKKQVNSLTKEELFSQLFELSFNDIRQGLNTLCAIYRNENEWCYVEDVYEDYFIMFDWDSDKVWKQNYAKDGDTLSLSGERIELFRMLLTESEKISIDNMRQNYETIYNQLSQYQKKELVTSKDYSAIAEKEDFIAIVDEVNSGKNDMTFEDLKDNLDKMLLSYAKSGSLNFEAVEKNLEVDKKKVARMGLQPSGAKGNPKKSRYGNIFKK